MMIPVRWFFYVPLAINLVLAGSLGSHAGSALADGDFARSLVVLCAASLFAANAAACGFVASGKP
jgi:hypothetical protein